MIALLKNEVDCSFELQKFYEALLYSLEGKF